MRPLAPLAALAALLVAAPALAHDFWIEPTRLALDVGELVGLRLRIGHPGDAAEPFPRSPDHVARFELVGPDGAVAPAVGRAGADPAGVARPAAAGTWIAVYRSRPSSIEMEPAAFKAYLREEGLEHVVAERERRGERDVPGRERYERAAKALVVVGAPAAPGPDRAVGLPVELVAERAEAADGGAGAPLVLRVLEDGGPAAGVLVTLGALDGTGEERTARSDATGRAVFSEPGPGAGTWIATAVRMQRAEDDPDHDWHSVWASLVLERGG